MNCRILHERPGRLRVHMRQCNMSLSEADRLEAYLKGISGVIEVKVYERTADAVICYHFDSSHMTRDQVSVPVILNCPRDLAFHSKRAKIHLI